MFLETSRGKYGEFILIWGVRGPQELSEASEAVRGRLRSNLKLKMLPVHGYTFVPHLYPIWGTWGTYMICTPLWGTYFNENTVLHDIGRHQKTM
jgi:hypothetical protein